MSKLYFVTSNENKLREARQVLGEHIEAKNIDLPELQGEPHDIVLEKAKIAAQMLGHSVFVEDTSLCFNALGGLPGPYIKDFNKKLSRENIVKLLEGFDDKTAYAMTLIGYCEPDQEPSVIEGKTSGVIVFPRGDSGFHFDPIFQPDGSEQTYAEMTMEQKNVVSHRGKAFRKFREFLGRK